MGRGINVLEFKSVMLTPTRMDVPNGSYIVDHTLISYVANPGETSIQIIEASQTNSRRVGRTPRTSKATSAPFIGSWYSRRGRKLGISLKPCKMHNKNEEIKIRKVARGRREQEKGFMLIYLLARCHHKVSIIIVITFFFVMGKEKLRP